MSASSAPAAAQPLRSTAGSYPWADAGTPGPAPLQILASALVPGAGQAWGGRWWTAAAFVAVETGAWWVHLDSRSEGRRLRGEYRDLAWAVARGGPSPRIDGPFEYYERLAHWTRSGAFDADPGTPSLEPERDPGAFNGRQWRLAAEIYLGGAVDAVPGTPGYDAALAWYRERAYGEALLWDWTGAAGEQARYGRLIDDSDESLRRASIAAGVVVANHVLSAVEAFVRLRLDGRVPELSVTPAPLGSHRVATVQVRLPVRR